MRSTGNWWLTILLFTVIAKLVLMPLSLWCQWNSIVMVRMMPALNRVKVKYFGDQEHIGERQSELNREYHYHPLLVARPAGGAGRDPVRPGRRHPRHRRLGAAGTEFLGLVPAEDGGASWAMPVAAALSAVVMGCASNVINPLQREQSRAEKNSTNGLSIALSLFLGVYVSCGMAFYWVCSNLLSVAVQALCNLIISPARYVDYEDLAASKAELDELNSLSAKKGPSWRPPLAASAPTSAASSRSWASTSWSTPSAPASGSTPGHGGGLSNSDAVVHYVTGDPDDQVFAFARDHPRVMPYYVGDKRLITLMMKMDADVVVMTLDDLDNFYVKRSFVEPLDALRLRLPPPHEPAPREPRGGLRPLRRDAVRGAPPGARGPRPRGPGRARPQGALCLRLRPARPGEGRLPRPRPRLRRPRLRAHRPVLAARQHPRPVRRRGHPAAARPRLEGRGAPTPSTPSATAPAGSRCRPATPTWTPRTSGSSRTSRAPTRSWTPTCS